MSTLILVSGSQWATAAEHRGVVWHALHQPVITYGSGPPTLLHGDARGVDRIADQEARLRAWDVLAFPAEWRHCDATVAPERGGCPDRPHLRSGRFGPWCPLAGHRRNQQMVDAAEAEREAGAAVLVFAFPAADSGVRSGTGDLIDRAVRAGLRVDVRPIAVTRPTSDVLPLPLTAEEATQ